MEFGIFLNGYIPGPGAHDTEWQASIGPLSVDQEQSAKETK